MYNIYKFCEYIYDILYKKSFIVLVKDFLSHLKPLFLTNLLKSFISLLQETSKFYLWYVGVITTNNAKSAGNPGKRRTIDHSFLWHIYGVQFGAALHGPSVYFGCAGNKCDGLQIREAFNYALFVKQCYRFQFYMFCRRCHH